jgi:hypothetical protein
MSLFRFRIFSFLLAQKRNKKRQSAMKQPIADEGFQFSFCATVVKSSRALMVFQLSFYTTVVKNSGAMMTSCNTITINIQDAKGIYA